MPLTEPRTVLNSEHPYRLCSVSSEVALRQNEFIFLTETDNVFRNSYEWCGDNVQPWIDNLQSVDSADMPYWLEAFERGDSMIIDNVEDVKDLMPSEYQLLVMQDIHSEIAFPIFYIRTSSKALSVWTIPT